MARHKHIVNVQDLDWEEYSARDHFGGARKMLGRAANGEKLGCSLFRHPPGKRAWPFHCHYANEEAIYVLSGTGKVRFNGGEQPIGPGDYLAFPVGRETAHQVINDSDAELCYLCVSTMINPEIVEYPDSQKIGALAGSAPGGDASVRPVSEFHFRHANVPYWSEET